MYRIRSLRTGVGLMAAVSLLMLAAILLSGCSDNADSPTAVTLKEPPTLPVAEQFTFDFSFFDAAPSLGKAGGVHDNFVNAYLRAVVLDAMAHLVLAAPVSAFAAAVNTTPVALADGAWLWTYYWQAGSDAVRIELRGRPDGAVVQWELQLAGANGPGMVWFTGSTNGDGTAGNWLFRDLDAPGQPVSGEISWGAAVGDGRYLEFLSHEPNDDGSTLRFTTTAPDYRIDYTPGDGSAPSFIRWNDAGHGSLQVPDYNGGFEACWDEFWRNADCQ